MPAYWILAVNYLVPIVYATNHTKITKFIITNTAYFSEYDYILSRYQPLLKGH